MPLYCDALEALRHIPHTPDTLHTLARFFRSAFNRIAQPATGPHAFHNFWKDIEPSLGDLAGGYPEDLKVALCVCHQAFGMSLPSGMVIETESQVESQVAGRMLLVRTPTIHSRRSAQSHVGLSRYRWDSLQTRREPWCGDRDLYMVITAVHPQYPTFCREFIAGRTFEHVLAPHRKQAQQSSFSCTSRSSISHTRKTEP